MGAETGTTGATFATGADGAGRAGGFSEASLLSAFVAITGVGTGSCAGAAVLSGSVGTAGGLLSSVQ